MSATCCDPNQTDDGRLRLQGISTVATLVAILVAVALPRVGAGTWAVPILLVAYAAGGWYPAQQAFGALREGEFDVDLLMLLAAAGAGVVGHWLEGAILLFLFALGNTLETYAFRRTRESIAALVELRPEEAALLTPGPDGLEERIVPLDSLAVGDLVRVRPGDRLPVDGVIESGTSRIDESTLTGEPVPVRREVGEKVFAGTLNGPGSLDVRMTRAADDTALSRIIRLVEEARESKASTQTWIEQVESRYAVGVIGAAALAVVVPWWLLGWTFDDSFYRAMTLLVVASPCALVISIPATIVSAVSHGARHGILFKGGAHLDALYGVRTFAFDKTGTLTVGRPEVVALRAQPGLLSSVAGRAQADTASAGGWMAPDTEDEASLELLALAAGAELRSEHHLARAIVAAAEARNLEVSDPDDFMSEPGQGVEATVGGLRVAVGRPSWIEARVSPTSIPVETDDGAPGTGATLVHVAVEGRWVGVFAIQDHPREGTRAALDALRAEGIQRFVMLTGDNEASAASVAESVGIDEVFAGLKPDEKGRILEELRATGPVAMIGDGVNDAPALAMADVGVAMGVAGTDVALETADIVVMGEGLGTLARAVRLSRRTRRVVRQNLVFAVSVMVGLVIATLFGGIGLTEGVIGHEGSTVVVVFNGLRLLADGRGS